MTKNDDDKIVTVEEDNVILSTETKQKRPRKRPGSVSKRYPVQVPRRLDG